jgi:hypothetical protein
MSFDPRCPRKLSSPPETACPEGKKAVDLARDGKHGGCPFFINDRESNFCFFKFMSDNGQQVDTATIARLLMMDDAEVKKIIAKFRKIASGNDELSG